MNCSDKKNIVILNKMINELFIYNSKLTMNYDEEIQKKVNELREKIDQMYNKVFKSE